MGRGLSKLQKEILSLALSYRSRGVNYLRQPYILEELHGWNQTDAIRQYFSQSEIGKQRYNVARASLSRAITRLEKRGLVTRFPHSGVVWKADANGIKLTAEGVRIARNDMKTTRPASRLTDGPKAVKPKRVRGMNPEKG